MATEQTMEKAISRDGTAVGYFRSGAGRPLVLVHGTTADHTRWDTVRHLFEPHVSLAAIDRRGRGASGDAEAYAFEREVEDVVAVVDALAREWGGPVDLLGHSYGGLCALGAVLQTDNVRRLVVYEAPVLGEGVVPEGFLDRVEPLVAEGRFDEVLMMFFREVVLMPEDQLRAFRELPAWQARLGAAPTIARELATASACPVGPEQLAACALPTLLVAGGDSPEFLRRSTDALAAALPDVAGRGARGPAARRHGHGTAAVRRRRPRVPRARAEPGLRSTVGSVPTLETGPATIVYETWGEGPPVLLLAPGGLRRSRIETWAEAPWNPIEALAGHHRVVAMDQRNTGTSFAPITRG